MYWNRATTLKDLIDPGDALSPGGDVVDGALWRPPGGELAEADDLRHENTRPKPLSIKLDNKLPLRSSQSRTNISDCGGLLKEDGVDMQKSASLPKLPEILQNTSILHKATGRRLGSMPITSLSSFVSEDWKAPGVAKNMSRRSRLPSKSTTQHQLTHRQVPHGTDYLTQYCSACHFNDCERCSFCLHSKLARVRRLNLERFAKVVIQLDPHVTARALAEMITKYSRLDDYAREFNEQSGWSVMDNAFCSPHKRALDEHAARIRALEQDIEERRLKLAEQQRQLDSESEMKATLQLKLESESEGRTKAKFGGLFQSAFASTLFKQKKQLEEEVNKLREVAETASKGLQGADAAVQAGADISMLLESCAQTDITIHDEDDIRARLAAAEATIERMVRDYKQLQCRNSLLRRKSVLHTGGSATQKGSPDRLTDMLKQCQEGTLINVDQERKMKGEADSRSSSNTDSESDSESEDYSQDDAEPSWVDIATQTDEVGSQRDRNSDQSSKPNKFYLQRLERKRQEKSCAGGPLRNFKFSPSDAENTSIESMLGILGDVLERKVVAEKSMAAKGKRSQPLASHVYDFMSGKFGIKSMAKKRATEFLAAVRCHAETVTRVGNFAKLIGIFPGREFSYTRDVGDIVCGALALLIADPKAIGDTFSSRGSGQFFVSCQKFVASLIGDDGVVLSKPTTYDCPLLNAYLPPDEVKQLMQKIVALKTNTATPINAGAHLGVFSDPIDLDAAHAILIDNLAAAVDKQIVNLCRSFDLFAIQTGSPALDFDEYESLFEWACGPAAASKQERHQFFSELLEKAGDNGVNEIEEPESFALAVMHAGGALSRPAETRRYWKLPWILENDDESEKDAEKTSARERQKE